MRLPTRLKMSFATVVIAAGFGGNALAQSGLLNPANPASPLSPLNPLHFSTASSQGGNNAAPGRPSIIIMYGQDSVTIIPQPGQAVDVFHSVAIWKDVLRVVAEPKSSATDIKFAMRGIVFADLESEDADFIEVARQRGNSSAQARDLIVSMRNARIEKIEEDNRKNLQDIFLAAACILATAGAAGSIVYRMNKKPSP